MRLIYWIEHLIVTLGTLPYYRFFRQNTLLPVLHLAKCVRRGDSDPDLIGILNHWRERKLYELQFIQVAVSLYALPLSLGFNLTALVEHYSGRRGHWMLLLAADLGWVLDRSGMLVLCSCIINFRYPSFIFPSIHLQCLEPTLFAAQFQRGFQKISCPNSCIAA